MLTFMKFVVISALLITARIASAQAPAPPTASNPAPATAQENGFAGKVTETMNAGDYTYVQVDTGSNKVWAASPRFAVKSGDQVAIKAGMPMEKYHSKTLDRDFDIVYFTDRVIVNGAGPAAVGSAELPKGHPPITGAGAAKAPKVKVDLSGIKKAAGGKTVGEIFTEKAKLQGKEVTVRGKVVKFNPNIMGKNWMHIQDGTGTPGSDDLLVTTSTPVQVGNTVLVSGRISLNKDFGANYKYDVMIENAKVTVE